MKLEEIRGKPDGELKNLADQFRDELWKLKFKSATEPLDNPGRITELRKLIARIQGEIRVRELKVTKDKIVAELGKGDRSTREIHKAIGGSLDGARREMLRLARTGVVKNQRRAAPALAMETRSRLKKGSTCYAGRVCASRQGQRTWALKPAKAGGKK